MAIFLTHTTPSNAYSLPLRLVAKCLDCRHTARALYQSKQLEIRPPAPIAVGADYDFASLPLRGGPTMGFCAFDPEWGL